MNRLGRAVAALGTLVLLAPAACSETDDGTVKEPVDLQEASETDDGKDPERRGPVTIKGARKGGTVTALTSVGLTTPIDPSNVYYPDMQAILTGLVTRQLTQYVYDPGTDQMVLVPDLATDLGEHNEDYTEWTFEIRDGVRWENGDPVTAEDVAWGMCRSLDTKTFPEGPGLYYSSAYFLGGDEYQGPYTEKDPGCEEQEAISVDGDSVTVKMSKPFPDFDYYASMPAMGPIPQGKASDPEKYGERPLATGPYKIERYSVAETLVLVRNGKWNPSTDPGRTQYPDGYKFKAGRPADENDRILLEDSGRGQYALGLDDITARNLKAFQDEHADRLVLGVEPTTFLYAPDHRRITDKAVREALLWAMPYEEEILAEGLVPHLTAVPATSILPPGVPGREEYEPVPDHAPFETDAARARTLLEESGNLGFEIKFYFRKDVPTDVAVKEARVKALEKAGFEATPLPTTADDFAADRGDPDGPANLRAYAWHSDWPSGASWIPPVFQSTEVDEVGFGINEAAFAEPEVDEEINEVFELPSEVRPSAWQALEEKVMTTYLPVIPRYYGGVAAAHGSKVKGHEIDSTTGLPTFKRLWLAR